MMCFMFLKLREDEEYDFYDHKYSKNKNPSVEELIEILELIRVIFVETWGSGMDFQTFSRHRSTVPAGTWLRN